MRSHRKRRGCVYVRVFKSQCGKKGEMSFILKGQSYITPYLAFKGILLS